MFARRRSKTKSTARFSILEKSLRRISLHGGGTNVEGLEDVKGRLGLTLLFEPSEPLVDLIFVHGLRGGSRKTWSKTDDPYYYWPREWLPRDPDFKNVRIHSFGYNADWGDTKESFLGIHDFGKSLLGAMHDSPHIRASEDAPIILVGHSMGGLVIKKTYILARQAAITHSIAARCYAMVFLATPHRGSDSAQQLTNILRASLPHGSKPYLGDLARGSEALQSINEDFRHYSDDLQLRSFYETLKTNVGVKSVLIVDKASAILGYSNEESALINASHRSICKFDTPWDPNYVTLRNSLVSLVKDLSKRLFNTKHEEYRKDVRCVENFLGISERPEDDLARLEDLRAVGSCQWFTSKQSFLDWRDDHQQPYKVLWLNAKPATGKSVLAGKVVEELEDLNHDCSYYFFRHNDNAKSSLASCLRSFALQMAITNIKIRTKLLELKIDDVQIDKTDERAIWRKLFVNGIFQIDRSSRPHYWVIDALDECNNHAVLFSMLSKLETPFPLKIFVTSRTSSDLQKHFDLLRSIVEVERMSADDTLSDIELYVENKVSELLLDQECFRRKVVNTVVQKSTGCFLWVALVIEELGKVYTETDIQQVLSEVPPGMDALYLHTLDIMSKTIRNKQLVKTILTWILCASRPLSVTELMQALQLDLGININVHGLEGSINSDCGQLIFIDKANKVRVVHQTVREFLFASNLDSEFAINKTEGNGRLAEACLKYLIGEEMRPPLSYQLTKVPTRLMRKSILQDYACLSFSDHIRRVHSAEAKFLVLLDAFLASNVLSWIEYIAKTGELYHMTRAAKDLRGFLEARAKYQSPIGKQVQRVDTWAVDLIRVITKFGRNLLQLPAAIYWLIPPFCPRESALASQFGAHSRGLAVLGLPNSGWDDRIACISYHNRQATAIACMDTIFVVGLSDSTVRLYNSATLQEKRRFRHQEPAKFLCFSSSSKSLACSGRKHITIWNVATGVVLWTFQVTHEPLDLIFDERDAVLMVVTRENVTASWNLSVGSEKSPKIRQNSFEREDANFRRPLTAAALSLELNMSAVVYRGRPICLYDLQHDIFLGICDKDHSSDTESKDSDARVTPIRALIFNPDPEVSRLAAAYEDGDLALFDPCEPMLLTTVDAGAETLACSQDGRTLATGDSLGNIQIFEFETLRHMYRLQADDHSIRQLAFASDGLRFCDVRGRHCNVWEPSVLVRTEYGENDSVSDRVPSASKTVDIVDLDDVIEITSIACHSNGKFVFSGQNDGSVSVHDTATAKEAQILYKHTKGIPVSCLEWGDRAGMLVSADASSRIVARKLNQDSGHWDASTSLLDINFDRSIEQLLLNPHNDALLVSTSASVSLWNMSGSQIDTSSITYKPGSKWVTHPLTSRTVLRVDAATVDSFGWQDLRPATTFLDDESDVEGLPDKDVKCTANILNSKYLILEVAGRHTKGTASYLQLVETKPISSTTDTPVPMPVSEILARDAIHLIGVFGTKILFLNQDSWVCSISLDGSHGKKHERQYLYHFPIPDDWIGATQKLFFQVTSRGDFVFIQRDNLFVIKRGLKYEEHALTVRAL